MPIRKPIEEKNIREYLKKISPLKEGFDLIDSPVIITDPNGNVLYANKAVSKRTGFSDDEVLTKNPGDLWGGNMPKEFYKKMWKTIKEDKKPFVGEVKNVNRKGKEYWQEIRVSPVLNENGDISFFIGIQPDISKRKSKEGLKSEFISIVGHQLKNPVAATGWALEYLTDAGGLTPKQKNVLNELYSKNRSLKKLIEDLLLLAHAQDNKGSIKKEEINFNELVNETTKMVCSSYSDRNCIIKIDKKIFKIKTNRALAQQIIYNIIENALRYSDKENSKITVALKKEKNNLVFSCKDNGIGIPLDEQKFVFDKFYRSSNAIRQRRKGNGLGLYIVKLIAENFGWEISFISKPHKGSTFFIKIPLS